MHPWLRICLGWLPLERELPSELLADPDRPAGHVASRRIADWGFRRGGAGGDAAFDRATTGEVHLFGHSLGGAVALGLAGAQAAQPRSAGPDRLPAGLGPEIGPCGAGGDRAGGAGPRARRSRLKRLGSATPDGIGWDFRQGTACQSRQSRFHAAAASNLTGGSCSPTASRPST